MRTPRSPVAARSATERERDRERRVCHGECAPCAVVPLNGRRGDAWDNRAMPDGLVEMVVESVRVHMLSSQHVVILKESDRERYLPIWIGPWEANAIAMRLQGLTPERPLTHD